MNTSTLIIDIYWKNLEEFVGKKVVIFSFCFIMAFSLLFSNIHTLGFRFQPALFDLQPSMAWAETSTSRRSALPDNSEHVFFKTP